MTPAQSFEFSFLFWLRRLWFSSRMVDRPTNRSMINIENDSRYSLAVQYTHYCYLNMFIGLCERTLNERAQATKPTSRWEFIISFTFRAARQNWWSCTSGTEATCVREMKWNELNVVRRMPFAGLNVPCAYMHSSISNGVAAQWQRQQQQQQQQPQHPSTKCHCTMFAFCNAAHSFDLQFLAFYLVAFVAASARQMFVPRARFLST